VTLQPGAAVAGDHVVDDGHDPLSVRLPSLERDAALQGRRRGAVVAEDPVLQDCDPGGAVGEAVRGAQSEQDAGAGVLLDRVPSDLEVDDRVVRIVGLDVDTG